MAEMKRTVVRLTLGEQIQAADYLKTQKDKIVGGTVSADDVVKAVGGLVKKAVTKSHITSILAGLGWGFPSSKGGNFIATLQKRVVELEAELAKYKLAGAKAA